MKSSVYIDKSCGTGVAPFAGAWIEIVLTVLWKVFRMSLPSRERGLKWRCRCPSAGQTLSLPSRERGLKWRCRCPSAGQTLSLPSRERGLKSGRCAFLYRQSGSLPSRERGLKSLHGGAGGILKRRSLRGSVD